MQPTYASHHILAENFLVIPPHAKQCFRTCRRTDQIYSLASGSNTRSTLSIAADSDYKRQVGRAWDFGNIASWVSDRPFLSRPSLSATARKWIPLQLANTNRTVISGSLNRSHILNSNHSLFWLSCERNTLKHIDWKSMQMTKNISESCRAQVKPTNLSQPSKTC